MQMAFRVRQAGRMLKRSMVGFVVMCGLVVIARVTTGEPPPVVGTASLPRGEALGAPDESGDPRIFPPLIPPGIGVECCKSTLCYQQQQTCHKQCDQQYPYTDSKYAKQNADCRGLCDGYAMRCYPCCANAKNENQNCGGTYCWK